MQRWLMQQHSMQAGLGRAGSAGSRSCVAQPLQQPLAHKPLAAPSFAAIALATAADCHPDATGSVTTNSLPLRCSGSGAGSGKHGAHAAPGRPRGGEEELQRG